jgi:magnesium-protoporphyrin IX monomethyl ester (oxidative) cyclase
MQNDVILAVFPWAPATSPSIQVGLLKGVLDAEGISCRTAHLNVEYYKFLHSLPEKINIVPSAFDGICNFPGAQWIFAIPEIFTNQELINRELDNYPLESEEEKQKLKIVKHLREVTPAFMHYCAAEILSHQPKVVGFSCTFNQRIPSLVLAALLKKQDPAIKIIMGGTYMEGGMGEALIRAFPWVDVVVRGDGEPVIASVCRSLGNGQEVEPLDGLCIRNGNYITIIPETPAGRGDVEKLPVPEYSEYFERIEGTELNNSGKINLPVESSRGCWWYRQKCKFCGRSHENLFYRKKSVVQVDHEMRTLAEKHRQLCFMFVDPCISAPFMVQLMQGLEDKGFDFRVWCQSRLRFKKDELELLGRNGMDTIFMGIEHLSTPVLKLMRKGHTAIDAIKILKWGAENGITITWNMIYGFPGETVEHYEKMPDLMRSLTHLSPPFHIVPLSLRRSAVYFDNAEEYGIQLFPPTADQDPIYTLAVQIDKDFDFLPLASILKGEYLRIPQQPIQECHDALEKWKEDYSRSFGQLWYRCGPGFMELCDNRANFSYQVYNIDETEGKIYLACEEGATIKQIRETLTETEREEFTPEDIRDFLDQLVEARLVYEENGIYISLGLSHKKLRNRGVNLVNPL